VFIGLDAGRRFVNAVSDVSDVYPAQSFFTNLQGPAPAFTYNSFFIGRNTQPLVRFVVNQTLVAPISFLGFTTTGSYPARSFDPGLKSYIPLSFSSLQPAGPELGAVPVCSATGPRARSTRARSLFLS
jgi:hypothetical protein